MPSGDKPELSSWQPLDAFGTMQPERRRRHSVVRVLAKPEDRLQNVQGSIDDGVGSQQADLVHDRLDLIRCSKLRHVLGFAVLRECVEHDLSLVHHGLAVSVGQTEQQCVFLSLQIGEPVSILTMCSNQVAEPSSEDPDESDDASDVRGLDCRIHGVEGYAA